MSENSGIPATLKAFRSQIKINDAITAMKASIIDERIHDALSKLLGDSLASWLLFAIATTLVNIKKRELLKSVCEQQKFTILAFYFESLVFSFRDSCSVLWHLLHSSIVFPHEGQNSSFSRKLFKIFESANIFCSERISLTAALGVTGFAESSRVCSTPFSTATTSL